MTAAAGLARPTDGVASTPSVVGYALAIAVSWPLVSVSTGWAVFGLRDGALAPGWWLTVAMLGAVAGPVGAFLVHATCDKVDAQWVHVSATGLVGFLMAVPASSLGSWTGALAVGLSAAAGRLAVTPWVPVVRLLAPAGAPWWRRVTLR